MWAVLSLSVSLPPLRSVFLFAGIFLNQTLSEWVPISRFTETSQSQKKEILSFVVALWAPNWSFLRAHDCSQIYGYVQDRMFWSINCHHMAISLVKKTDGSGWKKRYSVTRRKNRDTEQDNWLNTHSWPTAKLFHVHGKLIKTPTSCPSGLWRSMDLTHSVRLLKKVCTACWIGCFSQNLLIIGRFNHLSFENHFPTSEMLAVKEGKTPCDVASAKSRVRQSIVLG